MTHTSQAAHNAIAWLQARHAFRPTDSSDAIYEHMESQSGFGLPVIYQPFDAGKRAHFVDRAQILDFAVNAGSGRILDFGPGDGWPSLLIAPFVSEVVGVDASRRRVEVCRQNAARLAATNAVFEHVAPGNPLPFPDAAFNGICAASSIEQTPDVMATLRELHRVLSPGGRLRMNYESLSYYRNSGERDIWLLDRGDEPACLIIYDRHIDEALVRQYVLAFDMPGAEVRQTFAKHGAVLAYAGLTLPVLQALNPHVTDASAWTTRHPSCSMLINMLHTAGFSRVMPTYDGGWFARRLFNSLGDTDRPKTINETDAYLHPLVEVVTAMESPPHAPAGQWEPWITAEK